MSDDSISDSFSMRALVVIVCVLSVLIVLYSAENQSSPGLDISTGTPTLTPTPQDGGPSSIPTPHPDNRYDLVEGYYSPSKEEFDSGVFTQTEKPYWPPLPWKPFVTVLPDADTTGDFYNTIVTDSGKVKYPHPSFACPLKGSVTALALTYTKLKDYEFAKYACRATDCRAGSRPMYYNDPMMCASNVESAYKKSLLSNLTAAIEIARQTNSFGFVIPEYYRQYGEEKTLEFCMPDLFESPIDDTFSKVVECIETVSYTVKHEDEDRGMEICALIKDYGEKYSDINITHPIEDERSFLENLDWVINRRYTDCMRVYTDN